MKCFYSENYTFPLPVGHPFPMHKYSAAANYLIDKQIIAPSDLIDPGLALDQDILLVHTAEYLRALSTGDFEPQVLRKIGFPWSPALLTRSRAAVAGTMAAVESALSDGIGCNLAGGTHHAFPDRGEGYCVLNDIAIAIRALSDSDKVKVLIVDLDAHQGNGTNYIFQNNPAVYCYSIHVGANYPSRKCAGDMDLALERWVSGVEYLQQLKNTLPNTVNQFKPDLAFYLAGVDVHEDDRFGQMKLTTADMEERDLFTIGLLKEKRIPLVTVFGGGYNKNRELTPWLHCQTVVAAARLYHD